MSKEVHYVEIDGEEWNQFRRLVGETLASLHTIGLVPDYNEYHSDELYRYHQELMYDETIKDSTKELKIRLWELRGMFQSICGQLDGHPTQYHED